MNDTPEDNDKPAPESSAEKTQNPGGENAAQNDEADNVFSSHEVKPRAGKSKKEEIGENIGETERETLEQEKIRTEEEINAALAQSRFFEALKIKRKKQMKWAGILGGLCLLGLLIMWGTVTPTRTGSFKFGICRVFLELYVQYPDTLRLGTTEERGNLTKIWFEQIDSFGENHLQALQCYFKKDESGKVWQISRATIDRREIDPEIIERFNASIPMIYAYPPELEYYYELPRGLEGLKFDTDMFRKRLF